MVIEAKHCGQGCYAIVRDPLDASAGKSTIMGGAPRRADSGTFEPAGEGKFQRRFRPLLPGHYRLDIGRYDNSWACGSDLGELPAGARTVAAVWREPVEVKGWILDREGKPVADVPLFVRPEVAAAGGATAGWTCVARNEGNEPVTAEDGSFHVLVDPGAPVRIEAAWEGYPIGTASASVRGVPDRKLVVRLK